MKEPGNCQLNEAELSLLEFQCWETESLQPLYLGCWLKRDEPFKSFSTLSVLSLRDYLSFIFSTYLLLKSWLNIQVYRETHWSACLYTSECWNINQDVNNVHVDCKSVLLAKFLKQMMLLILSLEEEGIYKLHVPVALQSCSIAF